VLSGGAGFGAQRRGGIWCAAAGRDLVRSGGAGFGAQRRDGIWCAAAGRDLVLSGGAGFGAQRRGGIWYSAAGRDLVLSGCAVFVLRRLESAFCTVLLVDAVFLDQAAEGTTIFAGLLGGVGDVSVVSAE
jgi:hypothetical protein